MFNLRKKEIGIVLGLVLCTGVVINMLQMYAEEQQIRQSYFDEYEIKESPSLLPEKEKQISDFAVEVTDKYPKANCAMIPLRTQVLSSDPYGRYLVEVDTVAVSNYTGQGFYTYYIIVQETEEEALYTLPFGVERLESGIEALERDITISMMKVVNGWGHEQDQVGERVEATIVDESFKDYLTGERNENRDSNYTRLEAIEYTQNVIKLMQQYIGKYNQAVNERKVDYILPYIEMNTPYYNSELIKVNQLIEEGVRLELLSYELIGITMPNEKGEGFVMGIEQYREYSSVAIKEVSRLVIHVIVGDTDNLKIKKRLMELEMSKYQK